MPTMKAMRRLAIGLTTLAFTGCGGETLKRVRTESVRPASAAQAKANQTVEERCPSGHVVLVVEGQATRCITRAEAATRASRGYSIGYEEVRGRVSRCRLHGPSKRALPRWFRQLPPCRKLP